MSKIVVWFSCGAASAVAAKITALKYGQSHNVVLVNNPVAEEDIDNVRFLKDVESWVGLPVISFGNPEFPSNSAKDVWDKKRYMSGIHGAPCTGELKKQARYLFESQNKVDYHVIGFTSEEIGRHNRFVKYERENVLPVLIDAGLTKQDCMEIIHNAGISLPRIYSLGYPNANCIGCVKATSPTYWNLVRNTFPEVFEERAKQSRRIGTKLARVKGRRVFLDELSPSASGKKIKSYECGIFCQTESKL